MLMKFDFSINQKSLAELQTARLFFIVYRSSETNIQLHKSRF